MIVLCTASNAQSSSIYTSNKGECNEPRIRENVTNRRYRVVHFMASNKYFSHNILYIYL